MDTKVKICGIKLLEEVKFINEFDVDYIGLVFAKSKRQVDVDTAKQIVKALRGDIKVCGVFVNKSAEQINAIANEVGLDIAQVHKNYTEEMVNSINIPVWYAVSIKDKSSIDTVNRVSKYQNVTGVVVDSYVKGQTGGTGKTFNWDLMEDIDMNINLVLAGGLKTTNVRQAIHKVKPKVIDVSSGVECTMGDRTMKSKVKVADFINEVKGHE